MFAKEMMLDDTQCAYLLDVFYQLLGIDSSGHKVDCPQAQTDLDAALDHKFQVFKEHLTKWTKAGVFQADHVRKCMAHAKAGYFRHFRLFDYVFNNTQLSDVKRITIFEEKPMMAPALDHAMNMDPKPEPIVESKEEDAPEEQAEGEQAEEAKPEGEESEEESGDEDPLAGLEERLSKLELDDQSKMIITQKLNQFNQKIQQTVQEREAALEEKLSAPPGKKKK